MAPPPSLPPETRLGAVHLRVADLEGVTRWYEDALGFTVLAEDAATAALGVEDGPPLLVLHGAPNAPVPPPGATGLYHVAFLLPSRPALAATIVRAREAGVPFTGFADHNVSEAAYLNDPEGNGLELYADRDRSVWRMSDGHIFITTEPLDLSGLLAGATAPTERLPAGTRVGHLHLRVSDLDAAEAFYVRRLGFDVTARIRGAVFVSAGGYHHHLGLNVWAGEGARRPPEGSLGLASFDLVVPSMDARVRILGDLGEGTVFDLDDNGIRLVRG
ncbi:MAG TPA: VOC family protein [Longimicrobiales bacterium]|nr:VOC family protein [Longimicrobiales bacterium]